MALIGGGIIKDYNFSYAWGVTPSAAKGTVIMDVVGGAVQNFELEPGDAVVYSFGTIASFTGVVTEVGSTASVGQGRMATFTVADNRLRLDWMTVFAAFNIEDDTSSRRLGRSSPSSSGSDSGSSGTDYINFSETLPSAGNPPSLGSIVVPSNPLVRRRGYKSKLPANWSSGGWTYHDTPFTAREILNYCFNGAWGSFGFTRNYHSDLDDLVLTGLDFSEGVKLSSIVGDITQKAGLDIRITGARTLVWGRKGTGMIPIPDATSTDLSDSQSLSPEATAIRVVGDRIRLQVLNISLEPDWMEGWQAFIDEVAWRREVASVWQLPTATDANQAELSARANEITVFEYAAKKSDDSFLDSRYYKNTTRNHLPAWKYINEFVYRSYRIPPDSDLFGLPLSSLEMSDYLLCATEINGSGAAASQRYATSPSHSFYPQEQCQAMVKGQPLDLTDGRSINAFYHRRTKDMRTEWSAAADFEVEPSNFSIRFAVPTFIDGNPQSNQQLYIRPNKGEGGGTDVSQDIEPDSDYLSIHVPNPDYEILPAQIKASFCFLLGHYHQDYGGGPRREAMRLSGLDLHVLHTGSSSFSPPGVAAIDSSNLRLPNANGSFREILYEDGSSAQEYAQKAGLGRIQRQALLLKGGFTRNGMVGTPLTTAVDRVTVSINSGTGITEQIEYAKSRPSAFLNEGTLRRIQRTEDLYPGQTEIKKEIRDLRHIARLLGGKADGRHKSTHRRLDDVFSKPIGGDNATAVRIVDENAAAPEGGWRAGHLVWVDDSGKPTSSADSVFKGILVATPSELLAGQKQILSVAQSGAVPTLFKEAVEPNASVSAEPGDHLAGSSGSVSIGTLNHASPVPAKGADSPVYGLCRLGGSTGGPVGYIPWKPVFSVVNNVNKVRFNLGTVNEIVAINWDTLHTIGEQDLKFVILNCTGVANSGKVTGLSIALESSPPPEANATEGTLPPSFKLVLGLIKNLKAEMIVDHNLSVAGKEVFRKTIQTPIEGGESFVRFWRWQVNLPDYTNPFYF